MLVKLGSVWADPMKVVSISRIGEVTTTEGELLCEGEPDDMALIINSALQTQSYGGEVEKETPANS